MSPAVSKVAVVWCLGAVLAAACSSVSVDKSSSNSSASASASATGAGGASTASASGSTGGNVGGGIGFGGFPDPSTGQSGAGGSPAMPAPFDCDGCLCDGATHYCERIFGGAAPAPGPPPEPMCSEDAGPIRCKPLPQECLPMATCQCVYPQQGGCMCKVDPAGITVTCYSP